jgi:hypothetical protein
MIHIARIFGELLLCAIAWRIGYIMGKKKVAEYAALWIAHNYHLKRHHKK